MIQVTCYKCRCGISLPDALYTAARASEAISFYCPYGHSQHFPAGETEEDKLRRERDRLKQREAQLQDEIAAQRSRREDAERSAAAYKGQATRLRKRSAAGTCPCCQRTFKDMAEHMKRQHPDFVLATGAKVIPLKTRGAA